MLSSVDDYCSAYNFFYIFAGKRYYSSKTTPTDSSGESNQEEDLKNDASESTVARLKRIFAVYGSIGLVFHVTISLISFGTIYLIVNRCRNILCL